MTWPKTQIYKHFIDTFFYRESVLKAANNLRDQFCKRKPSFMRTYLNPCRYNMRSFHLRCFPLESVFFEEVTRKRPPRCALLRYIDYIHHVHRPHTFWLLNLPFPARTFVISSLNMPRRPCSESLHTEAKIKVRVTLGL